jgi:hypothetical protein
MGFLTGSDFLVIRPMRYKPCQRVCDTLAQAVLSLEAEIAFSSADIETTTGLAIGFRCIPPDSTGKADFRSNHLG